MRPGAVQEPGRGPARLVAQPDGYAEYVDPTRDQGRAGGHGQHRSPRRPTGPTRSVPTGALRIKGMSSSATPARRQRSIRSTITLLLIIPLLSLIALWVYAASGTVGPALAKQHSAALNNTVGQPILNMSVALQAERAQAFAWQASGGRTMPQAQLQQLFGTSDAAVAAWK